MTLLQPLLPLIGLGALVVTAMRRRAEKKKRNAPRKSAQTENKN